jgi:hypothetical protein
VRPEGLDQCKIPITPLEIETATVWFVAQTLNQVRHGLHFKYRNKLNNTMFGKKRNWTWKVSVNKLQIYSYFDRYDSHIDVHEVHFYQKSF